MNRNPKTAVTVPFRQPTNKVDPGSFDTMPLRIRLDLLDIDHPLWGWNRLTKEEHLEFLIFIKSLDSQTWAEVRKAAGGKGEGKGTNHHQIEVCKLRKEAQERIIHLHWEKTIGDSVFSLRLNNTTRVYGHRDGGFFRPIWHDPYHSKNNPKSIYPLL